MPDNSIYLADDRFSNTGILTFLISEAISSVRVKEREATHTPQSFVELKALSLTFTAIYACMV
jgi:hypothetical protein